MPELDFDSAHKTKQASDYPKLRLERNGYARILAGLEKPTYAYVHTLKAPKIVNGRPVTKEEERRDGSKFTDYVKDFLSRPLCLGDYGTIRDKGIDPDGCPMCEMAKAGDHVDPPQRRFAMHVIVYDTKHNSTELTDPFGCKLVMWTYTDKMYNKLVDIKNEWGDLTTHDLLLGPCTNEPFQQYEVAVASTAAWQGDQDRKNRVLATYKNNQATLPKEEFCGRTTARQWIEKDLGIIRQRWEIVDRGTEALSVDDTATKAADSKTLSEGLDGLLAQSGASTITGQTEKPVDLGAMLETRKDTPAAVSFDDLLGDNSTPAPATKTEAPAAADDEFDSLLGGLK